MEPLKVLEEKISSLITSMTALKKSNETLKNDAIKAKAECKELKAENSKLLQENTQLAAKVSTMEGSLLKGNERIEETKVVVDDLIRSIDALVRNEHQQ
jgi:predicted nuclease with TOPRIM domain